MPQPRRAAMVNAPSVEAYLAGVPQPQRAALEKVRKAIRAAAPDAEEVVSYGVPLYKQDGHVVGFAAFKGHLSLFITDSGLQHTFARELEGFRVKGTTVHFTPEHPLPVSLVRRIVKERLRQNQEKAAQRAARKRNQKVAKRKARTS